MTTTPRPGFSADGPDDDTVEAWLTGGSVPPGFDLVAGILATLSASADSVRPAPSHALGRFMNAGGNAASGVLDLTERRRRRQRRAGTATVLTVALALTSVGAAAAGGLPAPAQNAISRVVGGLTPFSVPPAPARSLGQPAGQPASPPLAGAVPAAPAAIPALHSGRGQQESARPRRTHRDGDPVTTPVTARDERPHDGGTDHGRTPLAVETAAAQTEPDIGGRGSASAATAPDRPGPDTTSTATSEDAARSTSAPPDDAATQATESGSSQDHLAGGDAGGPPAN